VKIKALLRSKSRN